MRGMPGVREGRADPAGFEHARRRLRACHPRATHLRATNFPVEFSTTDIEIPRAALLRCRLRSVTGHWSLVTGHWSGESRLANQQAARGATQRMLRRVGRGLRRGENLVASCPNSCLGRHLPETRFRWRAGRGASINATGCAFVGAGRQVFFHCTSPGARRTMPQRTTAIELGRSLVGHATLRIVRQGNGTGRKMMRRSNAHMPSDGLARMTRFSCECKCKPGCRRVPGFDGSVRRPDGWERRRGGVGSKRRLHSLALFALGLHQVQWGRRRGR